jgi:ABC-type Fe3+-hydroxamate transport system substrate-binding protein
VLIRRLATLAVLVASLAAAPARPRIVVLVPSLAQDAVAVGAAAQVVGVSKYTNDVTALAHVPVVADFESVDTEKIVALAPDVVVGIPSQARLVAPLAQAGIRTVLLPDDGYGDIFSDLRAVGALSGHAAQATVAIAHLQRETAALHASVRGRLHPTIFIVLGTQPIWTAGRGSYLTTLIELAGGRNAAADLEQPYGEYSEEALVRAQPDALVVDRAVDVRELRNREPWRSLKAVREGHVFATDQRIADALFRPGPRYIEGLRWLIARLSSLSTPTTQHGR